MLGRLIKQVIKFATLVNFCLVSEVFADEFYPTALPLRLFGVNQMNFGSCMSAARATALEHTFAGVKFPASISVLHLHNFMVINRLDNPSFVNSGNVTITEESKRKIQRFGPIVPIFFNPETWESADQWERRSAKKSIMPPIESTGIYDEGFPSAEQIGYQEQHYWYNIGQQGSININELKEMIKKHYPVVLSVQGDILQQFFSNFFDHITGLPTDPNNNFDFLNKSELSHDVAAVGFDDALQGLVVRNSWNDPDLIKQNVSINNNGVLPDLEKFKHKISRENLPGYYLIPYAYLDYLQKHFANYQILTVLSLNYQLFYQAYSNLVSKYQIINVPYSCDYETTNRKISFIKDYFEIINKTNDPNLKTKAFKKISSIIYKQMTEKDPIFDMARVPFLKNSNLEKVEHLERNSFENYCQDPTKVWTLNQLTPGGNQLFYSKLMALSDGFYSLKPWYDFLEFISLNLK